MPRGEPVPDGTWTAERHDHLLESLHDYSKRFGPPDSSGSSRGLLVGPADAAGFQATVNFQMLTMHNSVFADVFLGRWNYPGKELAADAGYRAWMQDLVRTQYWLYPYMDEGFASMMPHYRFWDGYDPEVLVEDARRRLGEDASRHEPAVVEWTATGAFGCDRSKAQMMVNDRRVEQVRLGLSGTPSPAIMLDLTRRVGRSDLLFTLAGADPKTVLDLRGPLLGDALERFWDEVRVRLPEFQDRQDPSRLFHEAMNDLEAQFQQVVDHHRSLSRKGDLVRRSLCTVSAGAVTSLGSTGVNINGPWAIVLGMVASAITWASMKNQKDPVPPDHFGWHFQTVADELRAAQGTSANQRKQGAAGGRLPAA